MIRYGQQDISDSDVDSVVRILRSVNLTQGPMIHEFEQSILNFTGSKHAVAVNSATSALHISCLALGLGPGDWLWTSPNSFVASANCSLYCGANVDFVDIDAHTYNMCPKKLEEKLILAEKNGKLPKIVIPVHFAGQACDMLAIYQLSKRFGFKIIEDASHAIGGLYCGDPIGNCRYSDITIFSFHPVKIITTGEGGMALTNNEEVFLSLNLLRSHGITRDPALMPLPIDGSWHYQQITLGYNYRMTDIQAALGVSQMTRLPSFVNRRREIAHLYDNLLLDLPVILPWQHPDSYSSFHLYVIRLRLDAIRVSHSEVFETLRSNDILVNLHYIPIHTQPFYRNMGFLPDDFPESLKYYREAISIPIHTSLTDDDVRTVVGALCKAIKL